MQGVIILGTDSPVSLAMIRELAKHQVPLHGIGGKNSIGGASRYLHSFEVRKSNQQALIKQLKNVAQKQNAAFIMTVSENDIMLLNKEAKQLLPLKGLVAKTAQFEKVVAKNEALEIAQKVGLKIPKTLQPVSNKVPEIENWSFPVVLKWSNPNEVQAQLSLNNLPLDKAIFCFSRLEVEKYLSQFASIKKFPLIQEYCKGVGLGHFIFMHNGKALQTFQHLRLREWPPEGGTSTACKSISKQQHKALLNQSIQFLKTLEWQGVAMVEYRYDETSKQAVFMEINGRFWGSLPLAVACNADFVWLQYAVLGLNQLPKVEQPQENIQCRFMIPEIKRLFRIVLQPNRISDPLFKIKPFKEIIFFVGSFFNPKTCFFVFQWRDPKPFIMDMKNLLKKLIRR